MNLLYPVCVVAGACGLKLWQVIREIHAEWRHERLIRRCEQEIRDMHQRAAALLPDAKLRIEDNRLVRNWSDPAVKGFLRGDR